MAYLDLIEKPRTWISSNDTTPGYLNGKLVAGYGITLTEQNDAGDETLLIDAQEAADDAKLKEIGFHDNGQPDISSSSNTYEKIASFSFSGSDLVGVPTFIKSILRTNSTSGDVKIYDKTNAATIAEKNFTNTDDDIIDLGTLSNITEAAAIWEVHIKRTGGGNAYISALSVGWAA